MLFTLWSNGRQRRFCYWFYKEKSFLLIISDPWLRSPWCWSDIDVVFLWHIIVHIIALHGLLFLCGKLILEASSTRLGVVIIRILLCVINILLTLQQPLWLTVRSLPCYLERLWTGRTDWQSLSYNIKLISYERNITLTVESLQKSVCYYTIWSMNTKVMLGMLRGIKTQNREKVYEYVKVI